MLKKITTKTSFQRISTNDEKMKFGYIVLTVNLRTEPVQKMWLHLTKESSDTVKGYNCQKNCLSEMTKLCSRTYRKIFILNIYAKHSAQCLGNSQHLVTVREKKIVISHNMQDMNPCLHSV